MQKLMVLTLVMGVCSLANAQDPQSKGKGKDQAPGQAKQEGAPGKSETAPAKSDAAPGKAAAPAAPPKVTPNEAFESVFKGVVGNWRCAGTLTMPAEMGGETLPTKSTMKAKADLNKFIYVGDWKMTVGKNPPVDARTIWSWDAAQNKAVQHRYDTRGTISTMTADEFSATKMVWNGALVLAGKPGKARVTVTMASPKEMGIVVELNDGAGWVKNREETCKKGGGAPAAAAPPAQ